MNPFCSLAVTLAISLGGSGTPPPAHKLETVMQDDAEMLARSHSEVRRNARRMADLGVDRVRLTASWSLLAPDRESKVRPRFDATDSRQYREETITRLDWAVTEARAAGMDVMIDLAFFAPRWAVKRSGARNGRHVWRPSVREFGRFSRAIAERYSGRFRAGGERLPAVRLWTTWNEPNHRAFLRPQWEQVKGRWRPTVAPLLPADAQRRVRPAQDRGRREPRADRRPRLLRPLRPGPAPQHRAASLHPRARLRGRPPAAAAPARVPRLPGAARGRLRPSPLLPGHRARRVSTPTADRVQIGELGKLTGLLAELHRRGRIERELPLFLTEYGYETNPPDPAAWRPRRTPVTSATPPTSAGASAR